MFMIKKFFYYLISAILIGSLFSCRKEPIKTNKLPNANAGRDTVILLPQDSVSLDGSSSYDPDGNLREYHWSKISGPSSFTIVSSRSVQTFIKKLTKGVYRFELKVTDNGGLSAKDTVMIAVDEIAINNHPPVADAGPDQAIALPTDSVILDGSQSSDIENNITGFSWTKISGPSTFHIVNADAIQTSVMSLITGVYQFELKVTDGGGLFAMDTVTIKVDTATSINHSPIANAGPDQVITLPVNSATLDGSSSSDPDNDITDYIWTSIYGASLVQISNTTAVQAQVTSLVEGVYQFELKVTDAGGLSSRDTVNVTVNKAALPNNCATNRPLVNATGSKVGNLSKPRTNSAVASAGNKIVFAGGISSDEPNGSSRVDIYDIAANTWSTAELSVARYGITAISAGNKIFFAGGASGDGFDFFFTYSNVDIYDVSTNTWSLAFLSDSKTDLAAAAVGNKVIFAGGYANGWSNKVDIYDISANTWSTTALSESKSGISAVTLHDKVYFAGGRGWGNQAISFSDRIDIYNDVSNSWSTSTLSEPKSDLSGIPIGNKIYWAGGYNFQGGLCKVEIKDVVAQTNSFENLSLPSQVKAVLKDNKIVFYNLWNSKFDIYDLNTNIWSIGVKPINIVGASIISVNNTIYIAGGFTGDYNNISGEVWKLEF